MEVVAGIVARHSGDQVLVLGAGNVLADERRPDVVAHPLSRLAGPDAAADPGVRQLAKKVLGPDDLVQRYFV